MNSTVVDHDNTVTLCRFVHFMRDQDDRDAVIAVQQLDRPHDLFSALRIKHRSRLVQHDAVRAHRNDARDRHALLLSAGKLMRCMLAVLIHADRMERLIDARAHLVRRDTEIFKPERNVLLHDGRNDLVIRVLEHHADMLPDLQQLFLVFGIHARDRDRALRWEQNRIQQLCHGRFAGAVMPQHRDQLTVFKFQ